MWIEDDDLNSIDVEDGAAPVAAGEIAVDRDLARLGGYLAGTSSARQGVVQLSRLSAMFIDGRG